MCSIYIEDAMFDESSVRPQEEMGRVMCKPGRVHGRPRNGHGGAEKNTPVVLLNGHSFSPAEEQNAHDTYIVSSDTEPDRSDVVL